MSATRQRPVSEACLGDMHQRRLNVRWRDSHYNTHVAVNVDNLLSPEGAIARRLDGFELRPQQIEMAAAVEKTFQHKGRLPCFGSGD